LGSEGIALRYGRLCHRWWWKWWTENPCPCRELDCGLSTYSQWLLWI